MQARRRFADHDESVALIATAAAADPDDTHTKYQHAAPANRWSSLGGYLPSKQQLTQAFHAPLQHLQQSVVAPLLLDAPNGSYRFDGPPNAFDDDDSASASSAEQPDLEVMASRDRTGEFASAIRSLQSRNLTRAINVRDPRKATQLQSYAEFMLIAKNVGKNIASTYAKLEKLTMLAKRKSLFDDRPAEIQELTYIIKGDLNALNQQIARLQDVSRAQRKSTGGKHLQSHSSNMVLALQAKLANMSTDFKQILEVRTENLKHQKTRRDQFSQGPMASPMPPPAGAAGAGSLLLSERNQQVTIDLDGTATESSALLPANHQQQQQQQMMLMYDESDNYVQQRAETMQNIESTIVELGGIFQQLAHMVKEQEEMVERIDSNVQDAELNVEAAHGQILKYFQSVTNNRWLMVKIFGVLIAFFLFFVIFMA